MPYLNLDLDYFSHPKTSRLVGLLGRGAAELPIRLWAYCGKYHAESGNLAGHSTQEIESVVGWWGKPGEAVRALVRVGYLDKVGDSYACHDWEDHEGHIIAFQVRAKAGAKARWDKIRNGYDASSNATSIAKSQPKQSSLPTLPTNHKDIKDGQPQAAALDLFMAHFTQALRKKAGVPADQQAKDYERKLTKKAYGLVIGYLKSHPDQGDSLAQEFDFLQSGMDRDWYMGSLSRIVKDRVHQELKTMTAGIGK